MSDKTIVALRGLIRGNPHWGDNIKNIENYLEGVNILTLEIAGAGTRNKEKSFFSVDENIHDLRRQFKEKCSTNDNHIMAISFGGMIATRWMELYPEDFKTGILVNTSFKGYSAPLKRLRPKAAKTFLKVIFIKDKFKKEEKLCDISIADRGEKFQEILERHCKLQKEYPITPKNGLTQIFAGLKFKPSKKKPDVPILILVSENDQICHSDCSKTIAKAWNAPIKIHPTAGHDLSNEDSTWIAKQVKEWFENYS